MKDIKFLVEKTGALKGLLMGTMLLTLAAAGQAQQVEPIASTGGGAQATASGYRLSGYIAQSGLAPATQSATATSGSHKLASGFLPELGSQLARNAADPAWLEMTQATRPTGSVLQANRQLEPASLKRLS